MESCGEVFEHVELKYCEGCGGVVAALEGRRGRVLPRVRAEDGGVCETAAAPVYEACVLDVLRAKF